MAEETQVSSGAVAQAAATAVSPDEVTANLLAKHSAGERLTQSEYGKLGAFASRLKTFWKGGTAGDAAQPAQPRSATGDAPGLVPLSPAQATGDGLAPVPADPRVVQRTTASILKSADGLVRRYVGKQARLAGADDRTLGRFDSAAACPQATQELVVEVSPDVAEALGLDAKSFPISAAIGGMSLWVTNLWLLFDELRTLNAQRAAIDTEIKQRESERSRLVTNSLSPAATPAPITLPDPKAPKGAPPTIT